MRNQNTRLQDEILGIIKQAAKDKPLSSREIVSKTVLSIREEKGGIDVRQVINTLRVRGYPICANGKGYWYARTKAELDEYIRSLKGRIGKEQEACDALEKVQSDWAFFGPAFSVVRQEKLF